MQARFYLIKDYDSSKVLPKYVPSVPTAPSITEYMNQLGATLIALKSDFHQNFDSGIINFDRSSDQEQIASGIPNYVIIDEEPNASVYSTSRYYGYFLSDYSINPNQRVVKLKATIDGMFLLRYGYIGNNSFYTAYTLSKTIGRSSLYTEIDFNTLPTNTERFVGQYELTTNFGDNNDLIANGGGGGWYIVTASGGIFSGDTNVKIARASNGLYYYVIPAQTIDVNALTGGKVIAYRYDAGDEEVPLDKISGWQIWSTDSTTIGTTKILHVQWVPFLPMTMFNYTTTTTNDSIKDRWFWGGSTPIINLFVRNHTYNGQDYAYILVDDINRLRVQLHLPAGYTYGKYLNIADNANYVAGQVAYKIGNELINYNIQDYRALETTLYQKVSLSDKAVVSITNLDSSKILLQLGEIAPVVPNSSYQQFLQSKAGSQWAQSATALASSIATAAIIGSIGASGGATLPLAISGVVAGGVGSAVSIGSAYNSAQKQSDSIKVGTDSLSLDRMNTAQDWSIKLGYGYFYNTDYSKQPVTYQTNKVGTDTLDNYYWTQGNKIVCTANEWMNVERLDALNRLGTGVYLR